ncbi:hypothetical protein [Actinoplanes sp. N902-109]|uniref:hypothetical protein n=1 Tax=Actinoplanes sp. (strain N902-109) TaxID=649831 RepID=UPI0003A33666|nr:hypothetical protein [Actinoplanes sp. N902-109]
MYAALRFLGRDGVAALIDRSCALARCLAGRLAAGGADILNDVVLNQVLVRFDSSDEVTRRTLLSPTAGCRDRLDITQRRCREMSLSGVAGTSTARCGHR